MRYILLLLILFACKPNQDSTLRINQKNFNKNKRALEKSDSKLEERTKKCIKIILTKNQDLQSLILAYKLLHEYDIWIGLLKNEDGRKVFIEVDSEMEDDINQIGRKIGAAHPDYYLEFKYILLNNYSKNEKEFCLGAIYQLPSNKGAEIYMSFIEKYNDQLSKMAVVSFSNNKYYYYFKFDRSSYIEKIKNKYPKAYKLLSKSLNVPNR